MDNENPQNLPTENSSGGCSVGCASFFVLLCVIWPLLHLLGGTYEPDILFFPMVLGAPTFLLTHILAIIALLSRAEETRRKGKRALWILWGGIAFLLLLGLIGFVIDSIRGK